FQRRELACRHQPSKIGASEAASLATYPKGGLGRSRTGDRKAAHPLKNGGLNEHPVDHSHRRSRSRAARLFLARHLLNRLLGPRKRRNRPSGSYRAALLVATMKVWETLLPPCSNVPMLQRLCRGSVGWLGPTAS